MARAGSSLEIIDLLIHVVGGGNHFGIGFVAALRLDQVDELVDDGNVGLLGVSLQQGAHSFGAAGHTDGRVARGVGGKVEAVAEAVEPGGILEVGELDLPGLLGGDLVGESVGDRAVGGDGDGLGLRRNGDLRLDGVAVGVDDVAVLIELEFAGAGISKVAGGLLHLEESVALNHQVQRIAGLGEGSLAEDDLVRSGARAEAELQSGRHDGLLAGSRAGLQHALVHQVLELSAAHLVAYGVGIGQIVGDVIDVGFLRLHAAGGAVECSGHRISCQEPTRATCSIACLPMSLPIWAAFCSISNWRMMPTTLMAAWAEPALESSSLPCSTEAPVAAAGVKSGSTARK